MKIIELLQVGPEVKEVLDTFRVAAELGSESLGAYVISMASNVWQICVFYSHFFAEANMGK